MLEGNFVVWLIILFYLALIAGLFVLFIFICRSICRSRGLPENYKWFGLLGVIGIIIVAVMTPPYNPYNPYYPPNAGYYNAPPPPPPPPYQQPGAQQWQEQPTVICPFCRRANISSANFCASCGTKLK